MGKEGGWRGVGVGMQRASVAPPIRPNSTRFSVSRVLRNPPLCKYARNIRKDDVSLLVRRRRYPPERAPIGRHFVQIRAVGGCVSVEKYVADPATLSRIRYKKDPCKSAVPVLL